MELFHLNSPLVPSGTRFYPVIRLVDLAHTCGRIVVQISYYFKIIEICKNPNFCPVRTKFTEFWYLPCIARGVCARYPCCQVLSIWYRIRSWHATYMAETYPWAKLGRYLPCRNCMVVVLPVSHTVVQF